MKTKTLLFLPWYIFSITMMCCESPKKQKLTKKMLARKSQSQPALNKPKTSYLLPQRALSSETITKSKNDTDDNSAFYLDALEKWKKDQGHIPKK